MASSLPATVHSYLANCTMLQISEVLEVIRSGRPSLNLPHDRFPAVSAIQPQAVQRIAKSSKAKSFKKSSMGSLMTKTRVLPTTSSALKRPLNSFIAFRSYYSPVFPSQQQKEISGLINTLWHSGPSKAKWSILAKAYSVIRDHKGKCSAPLDKFLALTGPFIGIISPDNYLTSLGWEILEIAGMKTLKRNLGPEALALNEELHKTNLSVKDIVKHCLNVGYIDADDMYNLGDLSGVNVTSLSMAARPARRAASTASSYTNQSFQIQQAKQTGVQASHPSFNHHSNSSATSVNRDFSHHSNLAFTGVNQALHHNLATTSYTQNSLPYQTQPVMSTTPATHISALMSWNGQNVTAQNGTNQASSGSVSTFTPSSAQTQIATITTNNNHGTEQASVTYQNFPFQFANFDAGVTMNQIENNSAIEYEQSASDMLEDYEQSPYYDDTFDFAHEMGEEGDTEFILDPLAGDQFNVINIGAYGTPYFNPVLHCNRHA